MEFDHARRLRLVSTVAGHVMAHAEALSAMDAALGDGDHGHNMRRGFEKVMESAETIAGHSLGEAAQAVGRTLIMNVGGASGAIFGTAFTAAGKVLPAAPTRADAQAALEAAIAAVRARGKAELGQKTMLDVLAPVAEALHAGRADVAAVAAAAAQATADMPAVRGRASFLGERSLGHVDPGARSAALIIEAICRVVEETP